MKVYILFDVVDCLDVYAEAHILMVSQDYEQITARMKELWQQGVNEDSEALDNEETWCGGIEAYVVCDGSGNYYRHSFWIEQHEVK